MSSWPTVAAPTKLASFENGSSDDFGGNQTGSLGLTVTRVQNLTDTPSGVNSVSVDRTGIPHRWQSQELAARTCVTSLWKIHKTINEPCQVFIQESDEHFYEIGPAFAFSFTLHSSPHPWKTTFLFSGAKYFLLLSVFYATPISNRAIWCEGTWKLISVGEEIV